MHARNRNATANLIRFHCRVCRCGVHVHEYSAVSVHPASKATLYSYRVALSLRGRAQIRVRGGRTGPKTHFIKWVTSDRMTKVYRRRRWKFNTRNEKAGGIDGCSAQDGTPESYNPWSPCVQEREFYLHHILTAWPHRHNDINASLTIFALFMIYRTLLGVLSRGGSTVVVGLTTRGSNPVPFGLVAGTPYSTVQSPQPQCSRALQNLPSGDITSGSVGPSMYEGRFISRYRGNDTNRGWSVHRHTSGWTPGGS